MNFVKLWKYMTNFNDFINEHIKDTMKQGEKALLSAYRNLKSDFNYQASKSTGSFDELKTLKKMLKSRQDNMELYDGVNEELYNQESIESEILNNFIPIAPDESQVIEYLVELHPHSRSKMEYKTYQREVLQKFGQEVDSKIIFKFISNDF